MQRHGKSSAMQQGKLVVLVEGEHEGLRIGVCALPSQGGRGDEQVRAVVEDATFACPATAVGANFQRALGVKGE